MMYLEGEVSNHARYHVVLDDSRVICNGSADEFSTSNSKLSTLTRFVRLALMRAGAGVRSLSARSFKVRHRMRKDGKIRV
jgi:hypothetical protein